MSVNELSILLEKLHVAQENGSKDEQIDVLFELAQYHYNESDFVKSEMSLKTILKFKKKCANVNYYLALIEIQKNNHKNALDYLEDEIKNNPENVYAKQLKEKLHVDSNFPLITIVLVLINSFIGLVYTFPQISFIDAIKFGIYSFDLNIVSSFTSLFFHVNILHLLINMLILMMFGLILEKHIGSIKFLFIYIMSGICGNFVEALFSSSNAIVLGASASLFGILGALMMREPLFKIRVLGIFKLPIILVLGLFFALSFIIDSFVHTTLVSGNIAHVIGLFIGIFVTGVLYNETISVFYNWILIAFGFWFVQLGVKKAIDIESFLVLSYDMLFAFVLVLIGIFFIVYSYSRLKYLEGFGEKSEDE